MGNSSPDHVELCTRPRMNLHVIIYDFSLTKVKSSWLAIYDKKWR